MVNSGVMWDAHLGEKVHAREKAFGARAAVKTNDTHADFHHCDSPSFDHGFDVMVSINSDTESNLDIKQ